MKLCRIAAILHRPRRVLLLVPLLAAAAGCVSPVDTARVAVVGGEYAGAMNSLMQAVGRVAVDVSSERLLQDDAPASQTLEQYRRLADADARRLETLERLRDHNRVIGRYFSMLGEWAGAPGAVAIRERLRGIARSLDETTAELRAWPGFPPAAAGPSLAAGAVFPRGRPADELRRDAPQLRAALRAREAVLRGLVTGIRRDFEAIRQVQEQRLIIAPLLSQDAAKNPGSWMMARRELLLLAVTIRELEKAMVLAGRLTAEFDALLAGGRGAGSISRLDEDAARLTAACKGLAE